MFFRVDKKYPLSNPTILWPLHFQQQYASQSSSIEDCHNACTAEIAVSANSNRAKFGYLYKATQKSTEAMLKSFKLEIGNFSSFTFLIIIHAESLDIRV